MSDSFYEPDQAEPKAASNVEELSVSELSNSLKRTVEERFGYVRVRGEISGYRGPHSSGHCYFSLKDDRARLEAVIWKGVYGRLKHLPEDGLEVIASGKLTTYPGSSKYQIVIDRIEPAGAGALMALLAERKKKFEAEGLFDPARKQLLPYMPKVIGVVTSPTGAVIRDVLHRLTDRFPLHVLVWPVRVQGETSGQEVATAINGFNSITEDSALPRPDILIVARGGGSIEDLWGFNDEVVVRAAAESDIPLISAVGHETDWSLLDYVADVRAPTPTGAAEMAVPVKADLEAHVASVSARLRSGISRAVDRSKTDLRAAGRGLASPDMLLAMPTRRLDEATTRLAGGLQFAAQAKRAQLSRVEGGLPRDPKLLLRVPKQNLENVQARLMRGMDASKITRQREFESIAKRLTTRSLKASADQGAAKLKGLTQRLRVAQGIAFQTANNRFSQATRLMESLSHKSVLARGFSLVRDREGKPVTSSSSLSTGEAFIVEMRDGRIDAVVTGSEEGGIVPPTVTRPAAKPKAKKPATPSDNQGSLF